jgi:tRNA nucleotidyltransferase/poly(A) polymerase
MLKLLYMAYKEDFFRQGGKFCDLLDINEFKFESTDKSFMTQENVFMRDYAKFSLGFGNYDTSVAINYEREYNEALEKVKLEFKNISLPTKKLINSLNKLERDSYIVGGFIRDVLAGFKYNDVDFATEVSYDNLFKHLKNEGFKVKETGKQFLIINVTIDNEQFEIAALRKDKDNSGAKLGSILEDAERRDFTNSALYFRLSDNYLLNPLGVAIKDATTKTIKFVGNAEDRIKEDSIRVFRFYRFIKRGWTPNKKDLSIVRKNFENSYNVSTPERVRLEIEKLVGLI